VLLAYPKAQILSFDDGNIREVDYEQTGSFQVAHRFLNHREQFLDELFADPPSLFEEE
jgi:predicted ATPase